MASPAPTRPYLPTIPSGDIELSWPSGSSSNHHGAGNELLPQDAAVEGKPPPSPLSPTGSAGSSSSGGRIRAGAFGRGQRQTSGEGDRLYQIQPRQSPPKASVPLPLPVLRAPASPSTPPTPPSPAASSLAPSALYPSSPLGTAGHSPNLLSPGIFLPSRTLPSPPTPSNGGSGSGDGDGGGGAQRSEASMSVYSAPSSYAMSGQRSTHSRPLSTDTRASGSTSGGGTELMMDMLAGQAAVDVRDVEWKILGWDEVEDAKKELSLLDNRLQSLVSRHQREQKILTAARTLAGLHVNHKRMSRQTTEELSIAEKRAASAEKDMWAVKERESVLRRRLTEHYAAILTWESTRLTTALRSAASTPQPHPPSQPPLPSPLSEAPSEKGKGRETELDAEVSRLQARVRELEELIGDAGEREAAVQAELIAVKRTFDGHRAAADEQRASSERELRDLEDRLRAAEDGHAAHRSREESTRAQGVESVRSILAPLLDRALPPAEAGEETLEDLALAVRDRFEGLDAEVRHMRTELEDVRKGMDTELDRAREEHERVLGEHQGRERRWDEERSGFALQIKELSTQHRRQRSTDASASLELANVTASLSHLWTLLPNPTPPTPSPTHARSPSSLSSRSTPNGQDFDLQHFIRSLSMPNTAPYAGIEAFSDRLKGFIDDALTVVERTGKYARERDIHKSNSERAQRLVVESRGALETYQRQVRALEERLEAEGGGGGSDSLAQFNELENTIAVLREEKRRMEASLRSQMEACDQLSEANEALSSRAMSISDQAAFEKRMLQTRLEAELSKLRSELNATQEELDDVRVKGAGPGIAMLEEMNALQDEVQMLRAQLRKANGGV